MVEAAYDAAKEHGDAIIVESMIKGFDHRLLVINGKLEAAARRMPGHVIGDGKHTVKELTDIVNRDPRRGIGHEKELTQIQLDAQAIACLAEKGYKSTRCRRTAKSCCSATPRTSRPAAPRSTSPT
jgi:cyanophycin synthetase